MQKLDKVKKAKMVVRRSKINEDFLDDSQKERFNDISQQFTFNS